MADKALLLGINKYKTVSGLRGCENDVLGMKDILTGPFGFKGPNVRALLNSEVTKTKVRQNLKWLLQDTSEGDRLVLHFSGHGSYRDDLDGDENDRVDELLCLFDMDFENTNSYLLDDEIREWTQKLPSGRQLLVVLDSCHSGTGTRKIVPPETAKRRIEFPSIIARATDHQRSLMGMTRDIESLDDVQDHSTVIARFVEPPTEILQKLGGARPRGNLRRGLVPGMNHVLLAACRDDQTAADAFIDGQFHGAFSYNLCKTLGASGGTGLVRAELINRLTTALAAGRYDQVPQFEASSDQGTLFVNPHQGPHSDPISPPPGEHQDDRHDGPEPPTEPPHVSPPAPDAPAPTPSDLPRLMEDFLATYNRILVAGGAIRPTGRPASPLRAAAARDTGRPRAVVYVHGICQHDTGFSNGWWESLSPFAPSLRPGDLGTPGTTTSKRYEVIWSDLVRGANRDLTRTSTETQARLIEILEDRARQQEAALTTAGLESARAFGGPGDKRALFGIPGLDCIGDFVQYLDDQTKRMRIVGRFLAVVGPLLRAGVDVHVVSHSWGTVVAYEALCQLETATNPGTVANFFTVGSALSIGFVRSRLHGTAADGHRPRNVANWVNLDAKGDIVGGKLKGEPYKVDEEFLGLDPVGCNPLIPGPACAHSSYFHKDNTATNKNIFGRFIES